VDLLIDTHVFLWWVESPETISARAFSAISDSRNNVFISSVSILEIAVKQSIGKLTPQIDFAKYVPICNLAYLPLSIEQAYAVKDLPLYHKDPFDRALVAQAKLTGLTLVTRDKILTKYDISILEA